MALVRGKTERVVIPHESEHWIEVRALSWRQLQNAKEERTDQTFKKIRSMGGEVFASMQGKGSSPDVAAAMKDPTNDYDQQMILRNGIVAWSYDEALNWDAIDDLDPETSDWAFREILRFSGVIKDEEARLGTFFNYTNS